MIESKITAAVIAVLFIGGAAAVTMLPLEDREGWYAWDPAVGDVDHQSISATPKIINAIEQMYVTAYGKLPPRLEAPKGTWDNPLTERIDGGIRINGSLGTSGGAVTPVPVTFTDDDVRNMKVISYGAGFTDSFTEMFKGRDGSVWDTVVAAGNSTWNAYPDNGMKGSTLGSEWNISFDALNAAFSGDDGLSKEHAYCLIVWGYVGQTVHNSIMSGISSMTDVKMSVLYIDYYSLINSDSFDNILYTVDALGLLIGIDTDDNRALSDLRDRLYSVSKSLETDPAAGTLKVYMELSTGNSPGKGTLAQLCFDTLMLDNINTTGSTTKLSDEIVVMSSPDVIFFDIADKRTIYQKMRIVS